MGRRGLGTANAGDANISSQLHVRRVVVYVLDCAASTIKAAAAPVLHRSEHLELALRRKAYLCLPKRRASRSAARHRGHAGRSCCAGHGVSPQV
jgi:hypothetical protein